MSEKPSALVRARNFGKTLDTAEDIQTYANIIEEVSLEAFKRGVQAGYRSILQDHRDGFINVSSATQAKLAEAIEKAKAEVLLPGEFFAD